MTLGRSNPSGATRRLKIAALRDRDGDACCHCGKSLDFNVSSGERPDFPTLEHHPIPWRECRSHELEYLKLAHRYCNERADFISKLENGLVSPKSLRRFEFNWHKRFPEAMHRLLEEENVEMAWHAHETARQQAAA